MIRLFPTLVHEFKIPDFDRQSIIEYCYQQRKEDPHGMQKSNRGGWQSQDHFCMFNNPLSDALTSGLSSYVQENNIFQKGVGIEVQAMWININGPGCYNINHNHPNSDLSGVFWVKGGPDMGSLVFDDYNNYSRFMEVVAYSNEFKDDNGLWTQFRFEPQEGECVLFPASLDHCVEDNQSQEERISVSFNIKLDMDFKSANIGAGYKPKGYHLDKDNLL